MGESSQGDTSRHAQAGSIAAQYFHQNFRMSVNPGSVAINPG
jgi:hypothetical protein